MKRLGRLLFWLALTLAAPLALMPSLALAASATLLPNGMQQFIDGNGAPYAGGMVYFYIPSTTTPKTTWSDSGATTPNTNPVILDSAGRATIYGSGVYRQVLKDQFGATVWDRLTADTASTSQSYAGVSTGSGNAQVLNGGTFSGTDGQMVTFKAGFTNTGPTTLNINGFGNVAVVKDLLSGPTPLSGGEITTANSVTVVYDQTAGTFHLVSFPPLGSAIVTTGITVNGPSAFNGALRYGGVITPTPIAANQNDYNPANLSSASVIRLGASSPNLSLTGLTAQPAGTIINILNVGTNAFSLQPNNTASAAANRFGFQRAEVINPSESLTLWYDITTTSWQLYGATPAWQPPQAVRQTVASGPTDATTGAANFIPATTASLAVTSQNISSVQPLLVTAAAGYTLTGQTDYNCLLSNNVTWTGLSASTTNFLYLTVNPDGTCTPGSTTTVPIYNTGQAIGNANGQYTFDTVHYQMWLGNGTTVNQVLVVFVGEATTGTTTVTQGIAYAYKRRYYLRGTVAWPAAGTLTTFPANLGLTTGVRTMIYAIPVTANNGWLVGDTNWAICGFTTGTNFYCNPTGYTGRNTMQFQALNSQPFLTTVIGTGANATVTLANWNYVVEAWTTW